MLDLSDLSGWSDEDVLRALDDDELDLNELQAELVDSWMKYLDKYGSLTERQREVAEEILVEVNE